MDLLQNPFQILTANLHDNRRKIIELADERSLLLDSGECIQACSELTHPRKRLSAEIAWLPGINPKHADELLSLLKKSPSDFLNVGNLTNISRANLLAAGLSRLPDYSSNDVARWILEITLAFEDISPKWISAIINEDRIVSGFPEVTDLSAVELEIQGRRHHYQKVIKDALNNLSSRELVETVTFVVESITDDGKKHSPTLISDLVNLYEVEAQDFLEKEEKNIKILVEKIQVAVDAKRPDLILSPMIKEIIQVVKNWDSVAQPIQVNHKSLGLDHDASRHVARLVRGLALHMYNEHKKIDFSQQLTSMLQEVFAEVVKVIEPINKDANDLDEISERFRKEITYEADVGVILKNKLRISPEGIEWKGHLWDLNSITRVRWGGTKHSVNGIPTGTTYSIIFGNSSSCVSIELKQESIYRNFTDRLRKSVGMRLLTEYIKGLRDGKRYRFDTAVMSDYGMELERKKMFCSNERVFCPWRELAIWNDAGVFCIGKKADKKLSVAFSYQEEDNIHILEAAVRTCLKQGSDCMSNILGK